MTKSTQANFWKALCALLVLGAMLGARPSFGDSGFVGTVVAVADGDTLTVLDAANVQTKIRLSGIDAPEKAQASGERAKQNLSAIAYKRHVEIAGNKRDRYGRLIAKVMVADPNCHAAECAKIHDAGLLQIMSGLAWHYKRYAEEQDLTDRQRYAEAEDRAKASKAGLWAESNPVAPWDWRSAK